MSSESSELTVIQELSRRMVEAQRKIRILDSIKWDDTIKREFFENKARKLPLVDKTYYDNKPLPFDVQEKKKSSG